MGVVLTCKENYCKWSNQIKHTVIFNGLWIGMCVEEEIKSENSLPQTRNLPFGKIIIERLMH